MTRAFRQAVCRILIGVLLFAQMAVAAYACPALAISTSACMEAMASPIEAADEPASSMPMGLGQMDMDSPNLCAAHCQFGEQTADPFPGLAVPAPVLAGFYVVPLPTPPVAPARPAAAAPDRLAAASPPHAILHCCFRI